MGRRQTNTHGAICMVYESLIPAYLQPGRSHPGGKLGDYCTYPRLRFTSLSRDLSRLQPDFNELQLRQGPAPSGRTPSPPAPAAIPCSRCHSPLPGDTPRTQGHPGDPKRPLCGPRDISESQGTSLLSLSSPPASDMGKRISGIRPGSFGFSTEERDPKPRAFGSRATVLPCQHPILPFPCRPPSHSSPFFSHFPPL